MAEETRTDDTAMAIEVARPVKKERIFFPNLDGLRFFSFLAVFLFHTWDFYFNKLNITGTTDEIFGFIVRNGFLGVNFFFVLSGFLITYLLIKEKMMNGKIHVINFYIRRILRIWPMFYLIVLIGLVIYPFLKSYMGGEEYGVKYMWTYFVFLNNFDLMVHQSPSVLSVLWSVAVEEQFYLCWPLILSLVHIKKFPFVFLFIIAGSLVFRFFHVHDEKVLLYHTFAVIGDMAMGGLAAYLIIFNNRFKQWIEHLRKGFIGAIYLVTLLTVLFRGDIFQGYFIIIERLCFSILFAFIILEQNFASHSLWKLANSKTISKWGIFTYGLYCLHLLALSLSEILMRKAGFNMGNPFMLLLTGLIALALSIVIAILSYNYFEKRFLNLKDKFAFIVKK